MIDAHCHLQDIREEIWIKADLEGMVCCGASFESNKKAIEIAAKHKNVWATVGIHPECQEEFDRETLLKMIRKPKVVAVGECGLDYGGNIASEGQVELFKLNVDLVRETELPLVVHCRNAFEDVFKNLNYDKVQMHCFTGNKEQMEECVKRGWYISLGGDSNF